MANAVGGQRCTDHTWEAEQRAEMEQLLGAQKQECSPPHGPSVRQLGEEQP